MVACNRHPILPFAQDTGVRDEIAILRQATKAAEAFEAIKMHVASAVVWVELFIVLLVESDAEMAAGDRAHFDWTVRKPTFIGKGSRIPAVRVRGHTLDEETWIVGLHVITTWKGPVKVL